MAKRTSKALNAPSDPIVTGPPNTQQPGEGSLNPGFDMYRPYPVRYRQSGI